MVGLASVRSKLDARMSHHPHQISVNGGASPKHKERESYYSTIASTPSPTTSSRSAAEPLSSNRLLAGYMAYEFLTKGTIFGHDFDPARAEAMPLGSSGSVWPWQKKHRSIPQQDSEPEPSWVEKPGSSQSYEEVASFLKSGQVHIPEIVNPAQLSRWIQM